MLSPKEILLKWHDSFCKGDAAATAEMVYIIENIFEDGEWAILEWRDPLELKGCRFYHIIDEKIVFQRGCWDKLSFLKQHNLPVE